MATAKRLRRQAETCATLASQTQDDEIRQRYRRLEHMYLQLAETEEQGGAAPNAARRNGGINPAA